MATLNESWVAYWSGRPLPSLKQTRDKLQPLMRRPERTSPADVAEIVLRDPLLTAQVLRAANQRVRSGLAADVVSVESAVMLFGVAPFFERFCRGPTVDELMAGDAARLDAFRATVLEIRFAARLARDYAYRRFDARLDEVYIAALLQGVPRLLALVAAQDPAAPAPVSQATDLLASWKLPEVVVALTREDGEAQPRLTLQLAALRLAQALGQGWWQPEVLRELKLIAPVLQCEEGAAWDVATGLMLGFARREYTGEPASPPARWLPMLPGPWPKPPAPKAVQPVTAAVAAPKSAQTASASASASVPASPRASVAASPPALNVMAERLRALQQAGRERAAANHIMSLAVRALADGLAMRRIMLALLAPDGSVLRARFCHGAAEADPLRNLALPLGVPSLFSRLLERPQCVRVDVPYRGEIKSLLPTELVRQIGDGAFCAMSLFVHDKPLGILYADRAHKLDEAEYHQLRQLCQLASQALSEGANRSP